jgi:hypothetical protein
MIEKSCPRSWLSECEDVQAIPAVVMSDIKNIKLCGKRQGAPFKDAGRVNTVEEEGDIIC